MPPYGKHPETIVRQESPFNAGPPPGRLRAAVVTPNDLFFVRNHGGVPAVDARSFRLEIGGAVERPLSLALADLEARPQRVVTATLECAGNRREELAALRPIPHELPWGSEAISTAVWSGVPLGELLREAGPSAGAAHVEFEGLDETERRGERLRFGGSVPLAKALAPETLLALEMNGAPLPAVHGYPVRALVPGWIGARSVKWVYRVVVRPTPSDNYFQAVAYRLFPAAVGPESVVWEDGMMLGEQALTSIVTTPAPGARIAAGAVRVAGLAYVGGGRSIERVELSLDGGGSWLSTRLTTPPEPWTWRFWEAEVVLPPGSHEALARAWDSAGQTQPESPAQVWNFKGYMNNAWARSAFSAA